MELSEERAARNEVTFRAANEEIDARRRELDVHGATPYICECDDPNCTTLVRLTREEYARVRGHARQFVLAREHADDDADVVDESEGWILIKKHGLAGEIAEQEG